MVKPCKNTHKCKPLQDKSVENIIALYTCKLHTYIHTYIYIKKGKQYCEVLQLVGQIL